MDICQIDLCSGCGVCYNICPKSCISMSDDSLGVLRPTINNDECIECGLCIEVCPQNGEKKERLCIQKCYAGYRKDFKSREDSSSGGVAAVLYEKFLEKWGYNAFICGVYYDEGMRAAYKCSNSINDVEKFKGSKYVQAYPGKIYMKIVKKLKEGAHVLFIGTPCQVAAVNNFLKVQAIDDTNLITVDLLCHGVSPQRYLVEEISYIENKCNLNNITKLSFRSNKIYRNFHLVVEGIRKGKFKEKAIEYNRYSSEDPYFWGFLQGITLRESCYSCKFSSKLRVADITIGDFIGLGKQKSSIPYDGQINNTSVILINSYKGMDMVRICCNELNMFERPIKEAIEGGCSLQKPFPKHAYRDDFLDKYPRYGFIVTIHELMGKQRYVNYIKYGIDRLIKKTILASNLDIERLKKFMRKIE